MEPNNKQTNIASNLDNKPQNNSSLNSVGNTGFSRNRIFPDTNQDTSLQDFCCVKGGKHGWGRRIFWICWFILGFSLSWSTIRNCVQKWMEDPVLTTVATTSLPVSQIDFPAVTVCTVNMALREKLMVQACLRNKTFTQMRQMVSSLLDPESRYNVYDPEENFRYDPKEAVKLMRQVAPKCSDFILWCELSGRRMDCDSLFKPILTETGYCCTFNSVEERKNFKPKNENERNEHEPNRNHDHHDNHHSQNPSWNHNKLGRPERSGANTKMIPSDSRTCHRAHTDEFMKDQNWCRKLDDCRGRKCGTKNKISSSSNKNSGKSEFTAFKAERSGITGGLTILTDTLACDEVPTDSFTGLKVYIHPSNELPVGGNGLLVGPGQESRIGVVPTDTYSTDDLFFMDLKSRMCLFPSEGHSEYFRDYSYSKCLTECRNKYILRWCHCVTFYDAASSDPENNVCSREKMMDCVKNAMGNEDILMGSSAPAIPGGQSKNKEKSVFSFGKQESEFNYLKTCLRQCQPTCNETLYNFAVTSAQFPNNHDPNKTGIIKEGIDAGYEFLKNEDYVSGSISLLRVYFKDSKVIQYKRDVAVTGDLFFCYVGGAITISFGISLLVLLLIEAVFSFIHYAISKMM